MFINTVANSKKTPSKPPKGSYSHKNGEEVDLEPLPWLWYKDRKLFSKIESGKMSDMVAFITGKIAISGSQSKWEGIDSTWAKAKEQVTERRKLTGGDVGGGEAGGEESEEEEEVDEEANIIAMYKPEVEPRDPRTREFWKRHFGTDFLVTSYLFLISTLSFTIQALVGLPANFTAHGIANAVASVLVLIGSIYFIKLSYPEVTMLMAYRVMAIDPNTMTFIQRYFTANEMLVVLWLFTGGFALPYLIVVLYELITQQYCQAITDLITIILAIPLTGVLNVSAMPDAMRANNGRGSSFFYDYFWVPLLRIKSNEARATYWTKHVGNDGLAGAWLFAILGVLGGIAVIPPVILNPKSANAWFNFWSTIPFTIGSVLLVRASYPENMNTSLFFSDTDPAPVVVSDDVEKAKDESTPLLVV